MCGIAAWKGAKAALNVYELLLELQHRGHDSAGIAALIDGRIVVSGGPGSVLEAIRVNPSITGSSLAIGHVRYSTSGGYETLYQPVGGRESVVYLAFNGNIVNYREAAAEVLGRHSYTWDARALADIVEYLYLNEGGLAEALKEASRILEGAYSLVAVTTRGELAAARDPRGIRPLAYHASDTLLAVASETAALRALGLEPVELGAGEILYCDPSGSCAIEYMPVRRPLALCAFEFIYFLRPDSTFGGRSAHEARKRMGERLADKDSVPADVVVPVPDSGRSAAIGYATRRGLRLDEAIFRSRYSRRVFISAPSVRAQRLMRKFQVLPGIVRGNSVVVVDDSIVRGDTSRRIIALLRGAGAREVHFRSSAPPVAYPCFLGIDMPTRRELIAWGRSVEDVRRAIGADTLVYNSPEDIEWAVGLPLCMGCFTSNYPLRLDVEVLERVFGEGRR